MGYYLFYPKPLPGSIFRIVANSEAASKQTARKCVWKYRLQNVGYFVLARSQPCEITAPIFKYTPSLLELETQILAATKVKMAPYDKAKGVSAGPHMLSFANMPNESFNN